MSRRPLARRPSIVLASTLSLAAAASTLRAGEETSLPEPISWWKGDGSALDAQGALPGTEVDGVAYDVGVAGQAFRFDGIDDHVAIEGGTVPSGDFTIAAWVNFDALSKPEGSPSICYSNCDMNIAGDMQSSPLNGLGWRLLKQSDDRIWFCIGACQATLTSQAKVTPGTWIHVAAAIEDRNETNATATLYIDGLLQGAVSVAGASSVNPSPELLIGRYPEPAMMYGRIDDVRVYDFALIPDEVAALHAATAANASLLPGTTLEGTIDEGDSDAIEVNGLKGMKLRLGAAVLSGDLKPRVRLVDGEGKTVKTVSFKKKAKPQWKTLSIGKTGAYTLLVDGKNGTAGAFRIETAAKYPGAASSLSKTLSGKGPSLDLLALPGATCDVVVAPKKKFDAVPELALESPAGAALDLSAYLSASAEGEATLSALPLEELGAYGLAITNAPSKKSKAKVTLTVTQPIGAGTRTIE